MDLSKSGSVMSVYKKLHSSNTHARSARLRLDGVSSSSRPSPTELRKLYFVLVGAGSCPSSASKSSEFAEAWGGEATAALELADRDASARRPRVIRKAGFAGDSDKQQRSIRSCGDKQANEAGEPKAAGCEPGSLDDRRPSAYSHSSARWRSLWLALSASTSTIMFGRGPCSLMITLWPLERHV